MVGSEEKGHPKKGRYKKGGGIVQDALRGGNRWTYGLLGVSLVAALAIAAALIMGGFGSAAYHELNNEVEPDVHNIKHQILNARHIPDRNSFTDDDDDGPDDDDDDDDDGDDDDSDWAVYGIVMAGFTEVIDGFDKHGNPIDGVLNVDRVPIRVWDENIQVTNGQVTSNCTNDHYSIVIAADSPDIPKGGVVGVKATESGLEGYLGFADYEEALLVPALTTSASLDAARMTDTLSVLVSEDAARLLSFVVSDGDTASASVVLDATAYTFTESCRWKVAAHGTDDFFLVTWQVPDGSLGINVMLVEITDYDIPSAVFSPVVVLNAGVDSVPNTLSYAGSNNFVLGFSEAGTGAQLVTITADTVLNTVVVNAPVLLSAAFGADCGVISGGVRGATEFVAVYGGDATLALTAEVFSISPAGVLASLAPGVVIYAPTTATFSAEPIGAAHLVVNIIDRASNVFGVLQAFLQSGTSIGATPVASAVYAAHPGQPTATGLVALTTPFTTLSVIDDTSVAITYMPGLAKSGFPEAFQVWDLVMDGGSTSLLPGDVEYFSEIDALDTAVVVLTPSSVAIFYGDITASATTIDILGASALVAPFDAVNGRNSFFVSDVPTHPIGLALEAASAGDTVAVLVSGCWEDEELFDFSNVGDLCLHGDGVLRSNCFAIPGQEHSAVPRKTGHILSQHSIVVQAPWTVDFP